MKRPPRHILLFVLLTAAAGPAPKPAATPRPAAGGAAAVGGAAVGGAAAKPSVEDQPLRIDPEAAARSAERQQGGDAAAEPSTGLSVPQVVGSLAMVVGLIFGLKWVAGRLSLVPSRGKAGAVKVVGRSVLSPKQQVLLIQVGRRLLVVGDSGGAMAALCEITDPDEVAALIGEARAAAAAAKPRPAGAFDKLFRGAAEPFHPSDDVPALATARGADDGVAVGGLLDKVRGLRQQFGRA